MREGASEGHGASRDGASRDGASRAQVKAESTAVLAYREARITQAKRLAWNETAK